MKNFISVLALTLAVGCGISDDKPLNEIDADLWSKVCARAEASEEVECDGFTIPAETQEEAEANCNESWGDTSTWTDCTATFGDWREAQEWDPEDPCDPGTPPAGYDRVIECATDAAM